MTSILMWFADDYGFFTYSTIFMSFMILCLVFYFSKKYAIKNNETIAGIAMFIHMVFVFSYMFTVSPAHIPQYGTQTQKEMLLICLQHEKNNELSEEEQKHISTTINDIMETCYKHHLNNEEYAKNF